MTKKQCGWLLCAGPLIGLVTLPMALTAATFPLPIPTRPTSFPLNRASALGRPVLWGSQTAVPANASNLVEIAAGENHTIGLRPDGLVVVWGNNTFGEMNVPPSLSNVVSVAAGGRHCAALTADGKVVAWGFNDNGQSVVPAGLSNVVAIAAGYQQTLALRQDGSLSVWGIQKTVPANLTNVVAIAAGLSYSLALRDDGTVTAWGSQTVVPAGLGGVVALAAGYGHVVALRQDGNLFSWGNNDGGQTNVPPGALNEVAVAAGEFHTLALKQDGTVLAWGNNSKGQTNVPAGLSSAVAIAAGRSHSAALERIGPPRRVHHPGQPGGAGRHYRHPHRRRGWDRPHRIPVVLRGAADLLCHQPDPDPPQRRPGRCRRLPGRRLGCDRFLDQRGGDARCRLRAYGGGVARQPTLVSGLSRRPQCPRRRHGALHLSVAQERLPPPRGHRQQPALWRRAILGPGTL